MINHTHTDGDTVVTLTQLAPNYYVVMLATTSEGAIRVENITTYVAAIRLYLGMIADEGGCYDQDHADAISQMVAR